MNEQRTEAYLNLIQQLLNCASEAEFQQCLTDHQELLDRELVQVVNLIAAKLEQDGQQAYANWLNFLADFIADGLELSEEEDLSLIQMLNSDKCQETDLEVENLVNSLLFGEKYRF